MTAAASPAARTPGKYEQACWDREERDRRLAYPFGEPDSEDPAIWHAQSQHPRGLWYDPVEAERPVEFLERFCCHYKGEWAEARGRPAQPLALSEWQKRIVRSVFGWRQADGSRRYRIAYVEVPRKNGKSTWAAGMALYLMVADGEPGAEIYSSATKKDQAKIVWGDAEQMVKRSPLLRRRIKVFRNNLNDPKTTSKFEPLGADSKTLDGLNPHGNFVDELHAHRDRTVWDVLDTAMGARRQPLTWAITTAGVYEPESIGWQMHELAVRILEQAIENDAVFAFIACADPEADWTDPATWATANPNFEVSVKPQYLAQQAKKAEQQPSFLNTFLRLHLNIWTQQRVRWIPIERWNASDKDRTRAQHEAREVELETMPCHGGLDLSTKLDVTALCLLFAPEPGIAELVMRFWIPEATILKRSREDRVLYDAWARDGWLTATPGNVIDYDFIRAEVQSLGKRYRISEVAFDPWNATQLAGQLQGDGFQMVEVRQGYRSLSEPCKEFEKLVTSGRIRHGGHPVLRWMVSNVSLRRDPNENIAPDKEASTERIDGVVATIMALSRQIVNPVRKSVYESRGVTTL